jgi:hypothetical protein
MSMRPSRVLGLAWLLGIWLLIDCGSVRGQIIYGQPPSGDAQLVYTHWSLKRDNAKTTISQVSLPLHGFVPIRDDMEALFYVASSSNSFDDGNSDVGLSGLGDLRGQFSSAWYDDRVLLGIGINLPTGKTSLRPDEDALVLASLSRDFLDFPMRRFGEGLGLSVLVGGAQMLGELRCGAGITYRYNGAYDPFEGVEDYNPGDAVSLNVGADWGSDQLVLSGDVILTYHGADEQAGAKVFKHSSQVDMNVRGGYRREDFKLSGYLGYVARGRNTLYTPDENELKIYGDQLIFQADAVWRLPSEWSVGPWLRWLLVAENDEGFGSSSILGLGAIGGRKLTERVSVDFGFKYFGGSANGGYIDVSGIQVSAGVTAAL